MVPFYLFSFILFQNAFAIPQGESSASIQKRGEVKGTIEYVGCSSGQITILEGHIDDVQKMASEAIKQVNRGNRYYDAFFGRHTGPDPNDQAMIARFRTLSNIRNEKNPHTSNGNHFIHCQGPNAPGPDPRCRGFGAPMMTETGSKAIWACASFWSRQKRIRQISPPISQHGFQPLDEYSPTGGLLLHEFTHSIWETIDRKLRNKEVMYGHKNTLIGVQERGAPAGRMNADSYRMFATAVYWNQVKGTQWSIDPNRLTTGGELRRMKRMGKLVEAK